MRVRTSELNFFLIKYKYVNVTHFSKEITKFEYYALKQSKQKSRSFRMIFLHKMTVLWVNKLEGRGNLVKNVTYFFL